MSKFLPEIYHTFLTAAIAIGLWIGANKSDAQTTLTVQSKNIDPDELLQTLPKPTFSISQANDAISPQLLIDRRAITVIGQGQATAPADTAQLEFRFANRASFETPQTGASSSSSQEDSALPGEEILKPVVDALLSIGVRAEQIEIQTSSLDNPKLLVTIKKPTRERVQEVVKVASSALKESDSLFIQGIGAEYGVKDCLPLERTARRAALRDAETQVKSIAIEMGIQLGDLLFVTVYPIVSPASVSACGSKAAVPVSPFATASESTPPYNPSARPEVQVRSQIGLTYAIK